METQILGDIVGSSIIAEPTVVSSLSSLLLTFVRYRGVRLFECRRCD